MGCNNVKNSDVCAFLSIETKQPTSEEYFEVDRLGFLYIYVYKYTYMYKIMLEILIFNVKTRVDDINRRYEF